jgi:hypothetical protein
MDQQHLTTWFARILIVTLIVTLALPITTLTAPGDTPQAPWSASAVVAKGKKHKKPRRPKPTTVTRAVRGLVTQTVLSGDAITIPGDPGATEGPARPYPATIDVSGFANGVITDVDLLLLGVSYGAPEDLDILLSKDDGRRTLVMSDVGQKDPVRDVRWTLDDEATASLPQSQLTDGIFQPTNVSDPRLDPDAFAAPAPAPNGSVALSTFDGANPNGTWQLWVMDDASGNTGDIRGWGLRITAEVATGTVEEQVPFTKDQQHTKHKKHKRRGKRSRK